MNYSDKQNVGQDVTQDVTQDVIQNSIEIEIEKLIKENDKISSEEISKLLGVSTRTIKHYI